MRTLICDLLGIDVPVLQAPFGPWRSTNLAAAVSNAGGLGSVGAAARPLPDLEAEWRHLRELTGKPFVINHGARPFDEAAFAASLAAKPAVLSYTAGDPGALPRRAHDEGILFLAQVTSRAQAELAAARGADAIIAQGGEAGGFGAAVGVGTMVLVPQVVDAVAPLPVIAAGGIVDGRGLAAALMLGAQAVNVGTRFLATHEAQISDDWKAAIVAADAEDTVRLTPGFVDSFLPPPSAGGFDQHTPRVLRTDFVDRWNERPQQARAAAAELQAEVRAALAEGRPDRLVPFTGQSAGLIHEILPAAKVLQSIVDEADALLAGR